MALMEKNIQTTEGKLSTALDNLKNAGASAMQGLLPLAMDLLKECPGRPRHFSDSMKVQRKQSYSPWYCGRYWPSDHRTGAVIKLGAQLRKPGYSVLSCLLGLLTDWSCRGCSCGFDSGGYCCSSAAQKKI
jgi:hypothetical protein